MRPGVACALVLALVGGCSKPLPEGPLAYTGFPNQWTGAVAVSQPRAWGLILLGKNRLRVRVERVELQTPLPDSVHTVTRLNVDPVHQVGTGATEPPPGAELRPLPATIRGPAQIVIWFRMDDVGVRYQSPGVVIHYAIGDQEYRAPYAVGVTVCAVRLLTPQTHCT